MTNIIVILPEETAVSPAYGQYEHCFDIANVSSVKEGQGTEGVYVDLGDPEEDHATIYLSRAAAEWLLSKLQTEVNF